MPQQAGETLSLALAEKIKEQFSKKIEGIEVSEEVLREFGKVDESSRLVSQLEKTAQLKAEATGRDREKIPGELAEDLHSSIISDHVNQAFSTITYREDKAGLHSSPEQSYGVLEKGVLPNLPITQSANHLFFSLDLSAEKWFKANKASLISQKGLAGEAKTTLNLQSEMHEVSDWAGRTDTTHYGYSAESKIPQSPDHLITNPLVHNIFNIQFNPQGLKDGEETRLLEEKINKILIEQAQRYGIGV